MLPRKTGKPIAFKCTEELRQQTEALADAAGETLSEYIRKAVEERNVRHKNDNPSKSTQSLNICNDTLEKRHNRKIEIEQQFRSFPKGGK